MIIYWVVSIIYVTDCSFLTDHWYHMFFWYSRYSNTVFKILWKFQYLFCTNVNYFHLFHQFLCLICKVNASCTTTLFFPLLIAFWGTSCLTYMICTIHHLFTMSCCRKLSLHYMRHVMACAHLHTCEILIGRAFYCMPKMDMNNPSTQAVFWRPRYILNN